MTNVTTLNVPDQRRVDELASKIIDFTNREPPEILLAALADVVTFLTTVEGMEHAYDYVVSYARNEAGWVWVKQSTPKPDSVTPFRRPDEGGGPSPPEPPQ